MPTTSPLIDLNNGKKRDTNEGDDPKSEDKDSNTLDTVGAHVGDTTTTEEFTTPSGELSISDHVWKQMNSCPIHYIL